MHPQTGARISDTFHIDLSDYDDATVVEPELYEHAQTIKKAVGELVSEVQKLRVGIEVLGTLAGATGLDLSVTTLKNISNIARGDERIEKIDPYGKSLRVFKEVLGVNHAMALRLRTHFRRAEEGQKIDEIEGITPELIERIKHYFAIEL